MSIVIQPTYQSDTLLGELKKTVMDSITQFKTGWDASAIPSEFGTEHDNDVYKDKIDKVIRMDIQKLNQNDKESIISDYGMLKAIKLQYDYLKNADAVEDFDMVHDMVVQIAHSEIGFRRD